MIVQIPRTERAVTAPEETATATAETGSERVLVVEDEVLVDLGLLVLGGLGEGGPGFDEQILPPADLVDSGVVDPSGPVEGLDSPLPCFMVFLLEHDEDFLELVVYLFEDDFVLVVEDLLVLLHLDVNVLDPFEFLLEDPEVVLVVAGDVGD